MFSVEYFKKDTVKIPVLLYVFIVMIYEILSFFDFVVFDSFVQKFVLLNVITVAVMYVFFKKGMLEYNFFITFFVFSITMVLSIILYFNQFVIYRVLWVIALIPFVYLYAGRVLGVFFSLYFLIAVIIYYKYGFFPQIKFQDIVAYFFSNIMISSISYFFVKNFERYAFKVEKEKFALENEANTDYLTEVLNRRVFFKHLAGKKGVLAILDLDNFKEINDKYSHKTGDEYLQHFIKVLKNSVRNDDIIARIGGDEFVVFFENADVRDIENWAVKFYKNIAENKFKEIPVSVSAGFVRYNGDIKKSMVKADSLLYKAKKIKNIYFIEE